MEKKEKKIKETEELMVESERRKAVVFSKMHGKLIRDIDRLRKRPELLSLMDRIFFHIEFCNLLNGSVLEMSKGYPNEGLFPSEKGMIENAIDTYKSIRKDFKEIFKMDDGKFKKLFPERKTSFEHIPQALTVLHGIMEQEMQMWAYLKRL